MTPLKYIWMLLVAASILVSCTEEKFDEAQSESLLMMLDEAQAEFASNFHHLELLSEKELYQDRKGEKICAGLLEQAKAIEALSQELLRTGIEEKFLHARVMKNWENTIGIESVNYESSYDLTCYKELESKESELERDLIFDVLTGDWISAPIKFALGMAQAVREFFECLEDTYPEGGAKYKHFGIKGFHEQAEDAHQKINEF